MDPNIQWENPQPVHQPMEEEEYKHHVGDIWKTTAILSVVTVVEVALALVYEFVFIRQMDFSRIPLMIFVTVASIVKAYYIMGVFMHMNHETKGFKYSILLPFGFLIWAIIAFSWDGSAWSVMRSLLNSF